MSRIKLVLLSMFAVLALGAVASSSASAACSDGGHKLVWCTHTNTEITNLLVLGTSGLSLLASKVGGAEVKIHCKDDTFHGFLLKLGTGHGVITYLTCTVVAPASGCGVNQPILANVTAATKENEMGTTLGVFTGAGPGEEFTKLTITGESCAVKGEFSVTGSQTVEFPKGEESLVDHEIVAKKALSKLKLGVETASYSGTALIHLHSLLPWLIMLGT